jgi:hypothetical protein
MRKDVIYIDIEDDITAIIDKLKNSKEKIIALVPPKGNSVLQSTVNLKLLNRAANANDKQPVIVTSNNALMALAGGLKMYVANNLQSKPYIPSDELASSADSEIEVSDNVAEAGVGSKVNLAQSDELEVDADELAADLEKDGELEAAAGVPADAQAKPTEKKDGKKVPNFNSFKKKLLLIGGVAIVLIILAVLFVFKPNATVVVRAETTPAEIEYQATISDSGTSDPENHVFRAVTQSDNKSITQDFTPTGKKDVGKKATGTVIFSTNQISALGTKIPAGTQLTSSGGQVFVTDSSVTMTLSNASGAPVGVTAAKSGTASNDESGSVSGAPSGVSASLDGSTSGGTDKTVTVVSQADIDKATAELKKADNSDTKSQLKDGFNGDVKVLEDSFAATISKVVSEPAVGQEANQGKLTAQVTYTMLAVKNEDLKQANEAAITDKMDNQDQQQVYKDGVDKTEFEKVKLSGTTATYKVKAVGQLGPKFDTNAVAQEISGKKVGEVRSYIQSLPGVKSTDINISPFWSNKTPAADKIQIKLEVDENSVTQ